MVRLEGIQGSKVFPGPYRIDQFLAVILLQNIFREKFRASSNSVRFFFLPCNLSGLIQMMASSACSRDLVYFTFGDAVSCVCIFFKILKGH